MAGGARPLQYTFSGGYQTDASPLYQGTALIRNIEGWPLTVLRRRRLQPVKCIVARKAGVDENGRRIGLVLRGWNLDPMGISCKRRAGIQYPPGIGAWPGDVHGAVRCRDRQARRSVGDLRQDQRAVRPDGDAGRGWTAAGSHNGTANIAIV